MKTGRAVENPFQGSEYKFLKRSPGAQRFADVSQKEAQWLLSKMSQPLNAS